MFIPCFTVARTAKTMRVSIAVSTIRAISFEISINLAEGIYFK